MQTRLSKKKSIPTELVGKGKKIVSPFFFAPIVILMLFTIAPPAFAQEAAAEPEPALPQSVANVIWLCLCAFLVFFMQAGFALVESGLTRAKNSVNIMMKNLLDFCFGAVLSGLLDMLLCTPAVIRIFLVLKVHSLFSAVRMLQLTLRAMRPVPPGCFRLYLLPQLPP